MDLTEIESFDFFFESLWKQQIPNAEQTDKVRANIVDTILFRHGKPFKWLFTSEKTGVSISIILQVRFLRYILIELDKQLAPQTLRKY
jgi:hypothetical protein